MSISKESLSRCYQNPWVAIIFISGLTTLVYLNTLEVPFQYDDSTTIVSNPAVHLQQLSFSEIKKVLHSNRPVSYLSFAVNYYWGEYQVIGYHLVNLAIHALTAFAVYLFFLGTLGPSSKGIALLASMLWAVHPVQTQSVTYITQRMTSLATLFFMWSLVLYITARFFGGWKRACAYGISLLSALLAIGSKEMTAIIPIVILLYEYYFISRFSTAAMVRNWKYWVPFLIALLAIVGVYTWVFTMGGSFSVERFKDLITAEYIRKNYTFTERALTEFRVLIFYISLLVLPLPSRLNIYHDFSVSTSLLTPITTLMSLVAVSALMVLALKRAKSDPLVSFGILWFLITLVIESFVFQLDLIFEHRLYLPSVGFFLILGRIFQKALGSDVQTSPRELRMSVISLGILILGLYSVGTIQRNAVWQDEVKLWADTVQKSPDHPQAHHGLGVAYLRGHQLDPAIQEFEKALRLDPGNFLYRVHLGQALEQVGQLDRAVALFEEAIRSDPASAGALYYLGRVYYKQNKLERAEAALKRSIGLNPDWAPPYDLLGILYQKKEDWQKAALIYERLLQLIAAKGFDPSSLERHSLSLPKMTSDKPVVHYHLAKVYENLGRYDEAISQYQAALQDLPSLVPVRLDLARLFVIQRKLSFAREQYERILEEDDSIVEAHFNLAVVHELSRDLKTAAFHYQKFLDLAPEDPLYANHRQAARAWLDRLKTIGHEP